MIKKIYVFMYYHIIYNISHYIMSTMNYLISVIVIINEISK